MNNLNLDISSIKKYCEETKNAVLKYKENLENYFILLGNVDSCWNDDNTQPFVKMVDKDKTMCLEHIASMSKYIEEIINFCEDLKSLFSKKMGVGSLNKVKYLPQTTLNAKNYLDKCTSGINDLKHEFSSMNVPYSSGYGSIINNFFNDIDVKEINDLKIKVDETVNGIRNNINNSQTAVNLITKIEIDNKICELRYKTVHGEIGDRFRFEKEKRNYVNSNTIETLLSNGSKENAQNIYNVLNETEQVLIEQLDVNGEEKDYYINNSSLGVTLSDAGFKDNKEHITNNVSLDTDLKDINLNLKEAIKVNNNKENIILDKINTNSNVKFDAKQNVVESNLNKFEINNNSNMNRVSSDSLQNISMDKLNLNVDTQFKVNSNIENIDLNNE